ncbi:hypothetical protein KY331_03385 [Candidatus Woesearchaeota archaeon]|nr:hypothetical protein [Candidatus Woesearchaeota archaeon]
MFEDRTVKETPYGRLVEGIDALLITPEGEKILDTFGEMTDFYAWVKGLPDQLPEGRNVGMIGKDDHGLKGVPDLRFKIASQSYLMQKTKYGLLIEIPTLAEIQAYMAKKGNEGKHYEFVPQALYFGAGDFILTEWIRGSDWNNLSHSLIPKLHDAMQELRRDLIKTDLDLNMSGVNFLYVGKNRKTKKARFAVIDQLDVNLAERLK